MSAHTLALACGYAAFLAGCSALLRRSAVKLARQAAPGGGELPWPHSDAVALRRVMAATLLVLACFIVAVAAVHQAWLDVTLPQTGVDSW